MAVVIESAKLRKSRPGRTLRTDRSAKPVEPERPDRGRGPATPQVDKKVAAAVARAEAAEKALAALQGNLEAEREQAREQGHADAMREAAGQIEAERHAKLSALGTLLQSLASTADGMVADAEDDIVAIAFEAVARILGRGAVDRKVVRSAVRQVMKQVAAERNLVVRVSPADWGWLEAELDELLPQSAGCRVELVADERIRAGGCIVDSGAGALDARFDVQLERLSRVLLAARKTRDEHAK